MKNKVSFEVRLDEEMLKKLLLVAKGDGMTLNNYVLHLARTNIAYYERVHGKIKPAELASVDLSETEIPDRDGSGR